MTDRVSQKARSHILNKGKISQKARSHRRQDLTEGVVSHMKEDRVSGESHRRQALTEGRQGLTEGKVSQKARSHRRQSLTVVGSTCFRVSRKQGSYRRQGLTEGKVSQKGRCVTDGRV